MRRHAPPRQKTSKPSTRSTRTAKSCPDKRAGEDHYVDELVMGLLLEASGV